MPDAIIVTHKDLLEKEKKSLDFNIAKLQSFILSNKFDTLRDVAKKNLRDQLISMSQYSIILGNRIEIECGEEHLTDNNKLDGVFQKYDRMPKIIEAVQFTNENKDKVYNSLTGQFAADFEDGKPIIKVTTVHGNIAIVRVGDWIVKEPELGHYHPINDDIFSEGYARHNDITE